ncbi:MAG: hypothetical protein HC892_21900 [Saprospiraceae bacterium]|nr:hypothetical protein [Saprospiraceae bacterium]
MIENEELSEIDRFEQILQIKAKLNGDKFKPYQTALQSLYDKVNEVLSRNFELAREKILVNKKEEVQIWIYRILI